MSEEVEVEVKVVSGEESRPPSRIPDVNGDLTKIDELTGSQ
jgi:hypothetical protein